MSATSGGCGSVSEGSDAGESSQSTMSVGDSPSTSFQTQHLDNVTKITLSEEVPGGRHFSDVTGSKINLTMEEKQQNDGVVNMGFDFEEGMHEMIGDRESFGANAAGISGISSTTGAMNMTLKGDRMEIGRGAMGVRGSVMNAGESGIEVSRSSMAVGGNGMEISRSGAGKGGNGMEINKSMGSEGGSISVSTGSTGVSGSGGGIGNAGSGSAAGGNSGISSGSHDFKSINGSEKRDKVPEAVNLELVNMVPYSNGNGTSYGVPVNGIPGIPVKKDSEQVDMSTPYDEYFVPVNEHKKYMRGEKLYVTKDKRQPASWRRCISWIVACSVITVTLIVAILAGTGVILQPDHDLVKEASVGRNFVGNNFKPITESSSSSVAGTKALSSPTDLSNKYVPRSIQSELIIDNLDFDPALTDMNTTAYKNFANMMEDQLKMILFDKETLEFGASDIGLRVVNISQDPFKVNYRISWNYKQGVASNPSEPIKMEDVKKKLLESLAKNQGYIDKYHIDEEAIKVDYVMNLCQMSNGGCSHTCYYNYNSQLFTCTCPTNLVLDESKKNCVEWVDTDQDALAVPPLYPAGVSEGVTNPVHEHELHGTYHQSKHETEAEPTPEPEPQPEPVPNHDSFAHETGHEPAPEPTPEPTPSSEPVPEPTPEPVPESSTESSDHNANVKDHEVHVHSNVKEQEPTPEPKPEPTPEPTGASGEHKDRPQQLHETHKVQSDYEKGATPQPELIPEPLPDSKEHKHASDKIEPEPTPESGANSYEHESESHNSNGSLPISEPTPELSFDHNTKNENHNLYVHSDSKKQEPVAEPIPKSADSEGYTEGSYRMHEPHDSQLQTSTESNGDGYSGSLNAGTNSHSEQVFGQSTSTQNQSNLGFSNVLNQDNKNQPQYFPEHFDGMETTLPPPARGEQTFPSQDWDARQFRPNSGDSISTGKEKDLSIHHKHEHTPLLEDILLRESKTNSSDIFKNVELTPDGKPIIEEIAIHHDAQGYPKSNDEQEIRNRKNEYPSKSTLGSESNSGKDLSIWNENSTVQAMNHDSEGRLPPGDLETQSEQAIAENKSNAPGGNENPIVSQKSTHGEMESEHPKNFNSNDFTHLEFPKEYGNSNTTEKSESVRPNLQNSFLEKSVIKNQTEDKDNTNLRADKINFKTDSSGSEQIHELDSGFSTSKKLDEDSKKPYNKDEKVYQGTIDSLSYEATTMPPEVHDIKNSDSTENPNFSQKEDEPTKSPEELLKNIKDEGLDNEEFNTLLDNEYKTKSPGEIKEILLSKYPNKPFKGDKKKLKEVKPDQKKVEDAERPTATPEDFVTQRHFNDNSFGWDYTQSPEKTTVQEGGLVVVDPNHPDGVPGVSLKPHGINNQDISVLQTVAPDFSTGTAFSGNSQDIDAKDWKNRFEENKDGEKFEKEYTKFDKDYKYEKQKGSKKKDLKKKTNGKDGKNVELDEGRKFSDLNGKDYDSVPEVMDPTVKNQDFEDKVLKGGRIDASYNSHETTIFPNDVTSSTELEGKKIISENTEHPEQKVKIEEESIITENSEETPSEMRLKDKGIRVSKTEDGKQKQGKTDTELTELPGQGISDPRVQGVEKEDQPKYEPGITELSGRGFSVSEVPEMSEPKESLSKIDWKPDSESKTWSSISPGETDSIRKVTGDYEKPREAFGTTEVLGVNNSDRGIPGVDNKQLKDVDGTSASVTTFPKQSGSISEVYSKANTDHPKESDITRVGVPVLPGSKEITGEQPRQSEIDNVGTGSHAELKIGFDRTGAGTAVLPGSSGITGEHSSQLELNRNAAEAQTQKPVFGNGSNESKEVNGIGVTENSRVMFGTHTEKPRVFEKPGVTELPGSISAIEVNQRKQLDQDRDRPEVQKIPGQIDSTTVTFSKPASEFDKLGVTEFPGSDKMTKIDVEQSKQSVLSKSNETNVQKIPGKTESVSEVFGGLRKGHPEESVTPAVVEFTESKSDIGKTQINVNMNKSEAAIQKPHGQSDTVTGDSKDRIEQPKEFYGFGITDNPSLSGFGDENQRLSDFDRIRPGVPRVHGQTESVTQISHINESEGLGTTEYPGVIGVSEVRRKELESAETETEFPMKTDSVKEQSADSGRNEGVTKLSEPSDLSKGEIGFRGFQPKYTEIDRSKSGIIYDQDGKGQENHPGIDNVEISSSSVSRIDGKQNRNRISEVGVTEHPEIGISKEFEKDQIGITKISGQTVNGKPRHEGEKIGGNIVPIQGVEKSIQVERGQETNVPHQKGRFINEKIGITEIPGYSISEVQTSGIRKEKPSIQEITSSSINPEEIIHESQGKITELSGIKKEKQSGYEKLGGGITTKESVSSSHSVGGLDQLSVEKSGDGILDIPGQTVNAVHKGFDKPSGHLLYDGQEKSNSFETVSRQNEFAATQVLHENNSGPKTVYYGHLLGNGNIVHGGNAQTGGNIVLDGHSQSGGTLTDGTFRPDGVTHATNYTVTYQSEKWVPSNSTTAHPTIVVHGQSGNLQDGHTIRIGNTTFFSSGFPNGTFIGPNGQPYTFTNYTTFPNGTVHPTIVVRGESGALENAHESRFGNSTFHTFITSPIFGGNKTNFAGNEVFFSNGTRYNVGNGSGFNFQFPGQYITYSNSSGAWVQSNGTAQPSFVIRGSSGDFGNSTVYFLNSTRGNFGSTGPQRIYQKIFRNHTNGTPIEIKEVTGHLKDSAIHQMSPNLFSSGTAYKVNNYFSYISKCAAGQFQCLNGTSKRGSACISLSSKCDSINDCSDGSDELGCAENGCPGNFQCSDGSCLKRHLVCNGIVDCSDGSDETKCESWKCEFDEFQCPSGRCIPVVWQCDNKPDCDNHTDEYNCQTSCGNDEYLCPEGWCIPLTQKCNGIKECSNGEDEQLCDCSHDEFKCQTGGCAQKSQVCNGLDDCPDRSDEWDCVRIENVTSFLKIKTPSGDYEPVCLDNWSNRRSDEVCSSLGYSTSVALESEHDSSITTEKSFYVLKNDMTENFNNKKFLVNLIRSNGTCSSGKLVQINCQKFSCGSRSMTDSSSVEARLVGGMSATAGQWPSVALLYNIRNFHSCTANVLTPRWVLASYNCLKMGNKNLNQQDWKMFGGSTVFEAEKYNAETRDIISIVPHPQVKFNQFLFSNDLALVEVDRPLQFTSSVGAVCLPEHEIQPRQICVTAGWGINSPGDKSIKQQLHYLPVPTMNLTECNSTDHYSGFITDDKICAGYNTAEKSLCYNEEGAPLMCVNDRGEWELQGILSYHSNCGRGSHPSIFSSISSVKDWIKRTTGNGFDRKTTNVIR